jgi:hypothetical protein
LRDLSTFESSESKSFQNRAPVIGFGNTSESLKQRFAKSLIALSIIASLPRPEIPRGRKKEEITEARNNLCQQQQQL